jgi:Transglycosylase SLT domain
MPVVAVGTGTEDALSPPVPEALRQIQREHEAELDQARRQARKARARERRARREARAARRRAFALRQTLLRRPSVAEAINLAGATYGQTPALWRKAFCESRFDPGARNQSGAAGLFQFLPSTWHSTPYRGFSVYSAEASALAAGWMHAHGRAGEWSCR